MSQPDPGNNPNKRTIMVDGQPVDLDTFMQMQSGVGGPIPVPKKRRSGAGCTLGLILFIAVLVIIPIAIVAIVLTSVNSSLGGTLGNVGNILSEAGNIKATVEAEKPQTRPVSGDASHFDPLESLADVREFAGEGAKLASLKATYVRSDGTMDLTATYKPAPTSEYLFLREVPRPTDAPPIGVAGSTAGPWYMPISIKAYEPGATEHVTTFGGSVSSSYFYTNQGLTKEMDDPTTNPSDDIAPDPTCKFVDFWKAAIKKGAPEEAVAIIEYNSEGYTFNISGTIYLRFDPKCKLVE